MLQEFGYVQAMAQQGTSVPTYAYARNNPLRWTDVTRLGPYDPDQQQPTPRAPIGPCERQCFMEANAWEVRCYGETGDNTTCYGRQQNDLIDCQTLCKPKPKPNPPRKDGGSCR